MQEESVTKWLERMKVGDSIAAEKIWQHFVFKLQAAARTLIRSDSRRVYDEEDAAQSAFRSICLGLRAGKFPDLSDSESLWRLLVVIAQRKSADRHRYDLRQRRDVRRNTADIGRDLESSEPSPEFATEFVETCDVLFDSLAAPDLQEIARLKLEGNTDPEIAKLLGYTQRKVRRKLAMIRKNWETSEHLALERPADSD